MTKIKICGITNYKDAANAVKLGADFLGFNFYKKSPRCIEKAKARAIIKSLPKRVKKAGVFVNESIKNIKATADICGIDLVQLSGDEDTQFMSNLKKMLNKKIIKCLRVKDKDEIHKKNFLEGNFFDYILFDSFKEGFYGGTGTKFNWEIIEGIDKNKLFLAGGLNPSNVKLAIRKVKPYAVDVCSGVELHPRKKDFGKMKGFIEAVKQ